LVEVVSGQASNDFYGHTVTVENGELHLVSVSRKLDGVVFAHSLRVQKNTCTMNYQVECGEYCFAVDPSCKSMRCVVQSTTPAKK
jgi:hypothetical protein